MGPRAQALSLGTVDSLPQSMSPQDRLPPRLAGSWLLIHYGSGSTEASDSLSRGLQGNNQPWPSTNSIPESWV